MVNHGISAVSWYDNLFNCQWNRSEIMCLMSFRGNHCTPYSQGKKGLENARFLRDFGRLVQKRKTALNRGEMGYENS